MSQALTGGVSLLWVAVLCGLLTAGAAWWLPAPTLPIVMLWLTFCAWGVIKPGSNVRRVVCLNAGVLLLLFGGTEFVLGLGPVTVDRGEHAGEYFREDDKLAYGAKSSLTTDLQRYTGDELIYDVVYSFDEHGHRIAPPSEPGAPCVLFFGGSFTFGEGLNDHEALPYRFGLDTEGRYATRNFGFHGYGPHQMLAQLLLGPVDESVDCPVSHVVYGGAGFHVDRAAGLSWWEHGGPRFEISGENEVEYRGRWHRRFEYPEWLTRISEHSKVVAKLLVLHRPANEADRERYIALLETTRRVVEEKFPGAEFHILYWDWYDEGNLPDRLAERGFRLHVVRDILPDRLENRLRYQVHESDGHPNAYAIEQVSEYLAGVIDDGGARSQ